MLDLTRSAITVALGVWEVDSASQFEAGAALALNSSGKLEVATDGSDFFGVAKWNKTSATTGVIVDEVIVLTGTNNVALKHADLVSGSVRVTNLAGTVEYTITTDYTVNTTNGTIARVSGGSIADGQSVKVSYRYNKTAKEMEIDGRNYMNLMDDTLGSGRMTLIQDYAVLYTDQYDTSKGYTSGDALTVANGRFKPATGTDKVVAKVVKAPSASDPVLGLILTVQG